MGLHNMTYIIIKGTRHPSDTAQSGDSNIAWIAGISVGVGVAVILGIVLIVLTILCLRYATSLTAN